MLIMRGGCWLVTHPPPLGNGIVRVDRMKILRVTIRSDLKITTHVDEILTACTCSLCPLRILRVHGLSGDPLFQATRATTINRIPYAGSAWWGLTNTLDRERIERFCRKLERAGCVAEDSWSLVPVWLLCSEGPFRLWVHQHGMISPLSCVPCRWPTLPNFTSLSSPSFLSVAGLGAPLSSSLLKMRYISSQNE